jgi:GT2 family glycosyltransferase
MVSVVIPSWNAADDVRRVLDRLRLQEGAEFEVIVVDNGVVNQDTESVCAEIKQSLPRLKYLCFEKQLGYAGAVNEGAAAAANDLVAVINNDNLPEPRWLAELLVAYESSQKKGVEAVVTSHVHRPDFQEPFRSRINLWGRIVRVRDTGGSYVPFHPDGSSFLFSKKAFGQPYDPDYFIYHEDVCLGWRAWLSGSEVVLADRSMAETFDGGSTRRIRYLTAYYTERNRWLNYFKFLSLSMLVRALPLLLSDAFLKLAFGSHRRAKVHAWGWLLAHPGTIWKKRIETQVNRKRSDREILPLISGNYLNEGNLVNYVVRVYCRIVRLPLGF